MVRARKLRASTSVSVLVVLSILIPVVLVGPARADVPASMDNPPGCVTARSTVDTQCGAQGRDHFALPEHRPPIEACRERKATSGSVVTRILPDGPRREDGSLAFVSGACVYLPPNYDSSGLAYPVVYLLHGGGGDQANWLTFGNVQSLLDAQYAQDPGRAVIAVMPDGSNGQWYDYYDRSFLTQTYVLDHLLPYVDGRFRTIPDRRGRVIAGLSNGGFGAGMFAAQAPDTFVAAGLMSANIEAYGFDGLFQPMLDGPAGPVAEQVPGSETYYYGHLPKNLVPNLDHVDLVIDVGATCTNDALIDGCVTWAYPESLFYVHNESFRQALVDNGYAGTVDYQAGEGSHAWRWWMKWLVERHLPFFYQRMARPQSVSAPMPRSAVPSTFRYRSVRPQFAAWGYDVRVQRAAEEFLDLTDVRLGGLTIRGSGAVVVTTAGRYRPHSRHRVEGHGAPPSTLVADAAGRLRIPVDLGPSHQDNEYSAGGMTQSLDEDYFTTRSVTLRPVSGSTPWPGRTP